MCERRVTGNQLAASPEVKAHSIAGRVMPWRTWGLAPTYSGSSKFTKSNCRTGAYTAKTATNKARQIQRSGREVRPLGSGLETSCAAAPGFARGLCLGRALRTRCCHHEKLNGRDEKD